MTFYENIIFDYVRKTKTEIIKELHINEMKPAFISKIVKLPVKEVNSILTSLEEEEKNLAMKIKSIQRFFLKGMTANLIAQIVDVELDEVRKVINSFKKEQKRLSQKTNCEF